MVTHHHAVRREHRRWYDWEHPELFATVLRSVKSTLDPTWLLNSGALIDPKTQPHIDVERAYKDVALARLHPHPCR